MIKKNLLAVATGAALLAGAQSASALTAAAGTANYDITLQPSCTATAKGASFGTHAVDAADLQGVGAGQVAVTCSSGTTYRIMFDGGVNGDGVNQRKLADGNNQMLYVLYDALTGAEVGDSNPLDPTYLPVFTAFPNALGIETTATGSEIIHPLVADVLISSANGIAGHFTDQVGVTVTY